ncbi:MAG TPA: heat-inducible transcriptional repressor HrcA [bacterium]|nr:heat-inducible transcriptional repressor HrcA [bacterium]
MALDPRKQEILRAVIVAYIHTAEPVGSESIAQRLHLRVSPATVRIEMAAMEEMGYLSHPHTSAGRIPTDRGYRVYVDAMRPDTDLSARDRARIRRQFKGTVEEQGPVPEGIARTLATVTDYASVVAEPPPQMHVFRQTSNILKQPEFQDARAAQPVLSALERDEVVADLLGAVSARQVRITIGSEHRYEDLRGCSLIAAAYRIGEGAIGALGILGPTRMNYAKVISLVRYLTSELSATPEQS